MMFQYKCLNPFSPCGTSLFTEEYKQVEELQKAAAVLVRSAAMHDMQDVPNLLAVARAGAGVNNIPIADYSEKGIVVFNTPGANANGVKEMVIAKTSTRQWKKLKRILPEMKLKVKSLVLLVLEQSVFS